MMHHSEPVLPTRSFRRDTRTGSSRASIATWRGKPRISLKPSSTSSILDQRSSGCQTNLQASLGACRRSPHRGTLPLPGGCERVVELGAADARRPAREDRRGRLLHLHLHQLDPVPSLRPGMGGDVLGSGPSRDRRAHTRVLVREGRREHPASTGRHAGRVPDRHRQRLRRLERVREPLLAGPLPHRRRGTHPAPSIRGGRVRPVRGHHQAAFGRCRSRRHWRGLLSGRPSRSRGSGGLGQRRPRRPTSDTVRRRTSPPRAA